MTRDPFENPFATPYACPKCKDFRWVSTSARMRREDLVKCPNCGPMLDDEYERFRRARWEMAQPQVSICELDLTLEELALFRRLRDENPKSSKATVLMWIEGNRYNPAEDPAHMAEHEKAMDEWRRAWRARSAVRHGEPIEAAVVRSVEHPLRRLEAEEAKLLAAAQAQAPAPAAPPLRPDQPEENGPW